MNNVHESNQLSLSPVDNARLANLCGQFDEHLRQIERYLGVEIINRGNDFQIIGPKRSIDAALKLITNLYETTKKEDLTPAKIHLYLSETDQVPDAKPQIKKMAPLIIHTKQLDIQARNPNQHDYLENILNHTINFGVGPAGTGKTYLAVACAVQALEREEISRVILVRPAVEAGERLGFLPGDLAQKIDPYLRPLYDALYETLGFENVAKLVENHVIEVAPLAYMRGRNLNDAFIILDEAQNTKPDQMKMFLTRVGFGSRVVIAGDITQTDLPAGVDSGLRHAIEVLKDIDTISFTFFQSKDVVRHPIVQTIIDAYDKT